MCSVQFAANRVRTRGNQSLYCVPTDGWARLRGIVPVQWSYRWPFFKFSGSQSETKRSEKGNGSNEGIGRRLNLGQERIITIYSVYQITKLINKNGETDPNRHKTIGVQDSDFTFFQMI